MRRVALTGEDLQNLRALYFRPEGKALVAVLERLLKERDKRLRSAVGEDLYRTQGRAQELQELLQAIEESDQTLNRQAKPRPVKLGSPQFQA